MNVKLYYLFFLTLLSTFIHAQSKVWGFNDTMNYASQGKSVLFDNSGNLVVAETFTPVYVTPGQEHDGKKGIKLRKFDNLNNLLWSKDILSSWRLEEASVTNDLTGSIYLCGSFYDTLLVDGNIFTSNGLVMFLVKYDSQGNFQWFKKNTGSNCWGVSVDCDAQGNVYVAGDVTGNITFDNNVTINSPVGYCYLVKYNSSGVQQWVINTSGYSAGSQKDLLHVLPNGDCYLTGTMGKHVTFGFSTITAIGDYDVFIAKVNTNGQWVWITHAGGNNGTSDTEHRGAYIDNSGQIYLTGYMGCNTAQFGTVTVTSTDGNDWFLAKYDTSGNCIWAKAAGGNGFQSGTGVTADNSGNIYMATASVFLIKFDSNGTSLSSMLLPANNNAMRCSPQGNLYITGTQYYTMNWGPSNLPMGANNDSQMFLAEVQYPAIATNIKESGAFAEKMIYPNPSKTKVFISSSPERYNQIRVYNTEGKMVLTQRTEASNESCINVSELPKGIYLIELVNDEKNISVKSKIVIE